MARAFSRNLWRQLVALVVAAGLWFLFGGQKVVERAIRVPLEYTNLPPGIEMTGDVPTVVDIRVRGSEAALTRIVPGELVAVVDLAAAKAGPRLFHVTGNDVRTPSGVTVVQVSPSNVGVSFEPSAIRRVTISPVLAGTPAYGFEVGTITASPPAVEVLGPAGALKDLQAVITEPISVAGASASVHDTVTVGVPDRTIRLRAPQRVEVDVEIRPAPVERIVAGVAVEVRGGRRAAPSISTVTVTIKGRVEALRELQSSALHAFVDVSRARPGQALLTVGVDVPAGIEVVRVDPEQLPVQVR